MTRPHTHLDLSDPVWTIDHVAQCFRLSVDRTREYTGRADFPPARRLGGARGRLFWTREDVLAWFSGLPALAHAQRQRSAHATAPAQSGQRANGRGSSYRPRARQDLTAAASR